MKLRKSGICFLIILIILSIVGCESTSDDTGVPTYAPTIKVETTPAPTFDVNEASPTPVAQQEIEFKDPNFEAVIRKALGKNIGDILVSDVQQITSLTARVCGILYVDELKYFTSLEYLDLYGNRINDLTPLAHLTSLRELNLAKNYNVLYSQERDGLGLTPLKGLINLEKLDLQENMITDISTLSSMVNLKELYLKGNKITDLTGLSGCISLHTVDLSDNKELEHMNALYMLPNIEKIIARNCGLIQLDGITEAITLRYLDVNNNKLETISPICFMTNLFYVDAGNNYISDISYLSGDISIKTLNVSYNLITDFRVILNMHSLKTVVWSGNPIKDYTPIDAFENKEGTNVENEPVN